MADEKIIQLPVPVALDADDRVHADDRRNQRLFDWARGVLNRLGLDRAIAQARTIDELRRIVLDLEDGRIVLAIRDALHPASGERQEHFRGLREGSLKRVLRNQFNDLKEDREKKLRGRASHEDWSAELILDKNGNIKAELHNLILIMREAPKWKGVLAYDEFAARVMVRKRPPFKEEVAPGVQWNDHQDSLTRAWFQREDIKAGQGDVGRAVQAAAKRNAYHPVREYLDGLAWDGVSRIDVWLVRYFHAEDSAYIRAIGPRWLIAAVARIFKPGCQADNAPVFEGPQGVLKSTALRVLAVRDAWFADRLSHIGSKDAFQELAGLWIVELAEMDALNRATAATKKSFLTRRHDHYRPPYGRYVINHPRQCVFAGTINPPVGGYLKDPTGNRRYWPIACPNSIDIGGLERDRDQLWAEAVVRCKAGAPWHLETSELEALATVEQNARYVVDVWEERIRRWLSDRDVVSLDEVLKGALKLSGETATQSAHNRVAAVLTHLEFEQFRPYRKGQKPERPHLYRRKPVCD
jgi:predicted P-loop ATPase